MATDTAEKKQIVNCHNQESNGHCCQAQMMGDWERGGGGAEGGGGDKGCRMGVGRG